MENLTSLNKLCDDKLFTELLLKYKNIDIVSKKILNKNIEDGIIKNFNIANSFQLEYMRTKYVFKYYDKEFVVKLIDAQILKNKRRDKMKNIQNGI